MIVLVIVLVIVYMYIYIYIQYICISITCDWYIYISITCDCSCDRECYECYMLLLLHVTSVTIPLQHAIRHEQKKKIGSLHTNILKLFPYKQILKHALYVHADPKTRAVYTHTNVLNKHCMSTQMLQYKHKIRTCSFRRGQSGWKTWAKFCPSSKIRPRFLRRRGRAHSIVREQIL